jgi:hypothetical protein
MEDFLNHANFSKLCDCVFAKNNFPNSPEEGIITIDITRELNLSDGNIVYTKFEYLPHLFQILNNQNIVKDLKLISHESDMGITKEIFDHKPSCVSKWYAMHVEYEHEDLIPLPAGLSHRYYSKTHIVCPPEFKKEVSDKKLLYINHRIETFPEGRKWIYEDFKTNDWCTVDQPNLNLDEYKSKLQSHKFILCPRGNGVDSCRVWECLYYGIIPIVEDHINFRTLDDLPAIRVPSFKVVTKDFLLEQEEIFKTKKFNLDKLNASWWIDKIRKGERL